MCFCVLFHRLTFHHSNIINSAFSQRYPTAPNKPTLEWGNQAPVPLQQNSGKKSHEDVSTEDVDTAHVHYWKFV